MTAGLPNKLDEDVISVGDFLEMATHIQIPDIPNVPAGQVIIHQFNNWLN